MWQKGGGGKYFPLYNYLKKAENKRVFLTYDEIEKILNTPLPQSAHKYSAWWSNGERAQKHNFSWVEAGYRVATVNFGESVEFIRIDYSERVNENLDAAIENPNFVGLYKEEVDSLKSIAAKMNSIQSFFKDYRQNDFEEIDVLTQFEDVSELRRLLGNIDNDRSFLACLLMKDFLQNRHALVDFNIGLKAQGAPGLDLDAITEDGKRIIGELKTTSPYGENDLGANQKTSFLGDFAKLNNNEADTKYFFVTDERTFTIVKSKYNQYLEGVTLVLLPQGIIEERFIEVY